MEVSKISKLQNIETKTPEVITQPINRDLLLDLMSVALFDMKALIDSGEVKDVKEDKIRLDRFKAFIYGCNTYSTILKAQQIDELSQNLNSIKDTISRDTHSLVTDEELDEINNVIEKIEYAGE